ncbi:phage regulatory CII family protein [Vogesella sp. XCS3]|uniref:phage regulatory CII family protein n=1 Tax=Vogesella sp. XCS3 TaxID=2877939 RepID=UPI001D0A1075|nr:phage regulatory CII family protein [Vogesella sp. XCS3]UDM17904.1 hypothetical protein LCH97_04370 [Vogesella sp. XCS3]
MSNPKTLDGKARHRDVFGLIQMQAREKGGLSEVARQLGKDERTFATKFNPNNGDHQPTAIELLDVIELLGLDFAVNAIALKVGRIAVEQATVEISPRELVEHVRLMMAQFGLTIHTSASSLADQRLDSEERKTIAQQLDSLIPLLIAVREAART